MGPREPISLARQLRKMPTAAEQAVWAALRARQLGGFKFRRQAPVGPYVVDFACFEKKLVVEIDGGQHDEEANRKADTERTAWLESRGFQVLRFWNNEVLANKEGVLNTIMAAVEAAASHPTTKQNSPAK